jgi:thiol-disulfide isomerase/thioredoxin
MNYFTSMIRCRSQPRWRRAASVALGIWLGQSASAIEIGASRADVIQELGKPEAEVSARGLERLYYGGREVELKFGRVTRFDPDVAEKAQQRRTRKIVEKEQPARELVTRSPAGIAPAETRPPPAAVTASATASPRVRIISEGGAPVHLADLLVPGKVTLVDFYADWCGPCRAISPRLEALANSDPDVYLRKVDIVNWRTEVARQYELRSIPSIRVYNRDGRPVGSPTHSFDTVVSLVRQAK